jgi:hypothetical protein
MSRIESIARRAVRAAIDRYQGSSWRWHLENARPELSYRLSRPRLSDDATRVVADLERDGIALIPADRLLEAPLVEELASEVARTERTLAPALEAARRGEANGNKGHYRFHHLGEKPVFDPSSVYARFSLAPGLRNVINAYYGLEARLRYYNIWRTFPTDSPPGDSQLWHRDQEDRLIVKAYLYLGDVGADCGPLTYIPGSHRKGRLRVAPEAFREPGHGNLRSRDDQMEVVVPRSRWREATGPRGTLAIVDTAGFHKGGFSRTQERLLFTCMFTSPASPVGDLFGTVP